MKKRILPAALAALALFILPAGAAQFDDPEFASLTAEGVGAPVPATAATLMTVNGLNLSQSTSNVAVDGLQVSPEGYCINQENYYKLRDLAFLLTGTGTAFDVVWDDANTCISMLSGRDYTITGGEMVPSGSSSIYKFVPSYSDVRLNGQLVQMTGYNINNNNYYRIRDVAPLIGFGVDWDKENYTVVIDSMTEQDPLPDPVSVPEENAETEASGIGNEEIPPWLPAEDKIPFTPWFSEASGGESEDQEEPNDPEEPVYPWIGPKIDGVLTILLDPGHGGTDPGSSNASTGQDENHTNLQVANYLRELLEAQGIRVIMTRSATSDTLLGPDRKEYVRTVCEEGELDLVLSIHHNGSPAHTARGTEIYVQPAGLSPNAGVDGNTDPCITSQTLGKRLLQSYMNMAPGLTNRGLKESDSLYMVYTSGDYGIPSVLSEFCFIDNANDVKLIDEAHELQAEAKAIFDALMELYATTLY